MKTPNPGSKEAQAQGCICAVIDNHYGDGFLIAPNEPKAFWITGGCPLHDKKRAKKVKEKK